MLTLVYIIIILVSLVHATTIDVYDLVLDGYTYDQNAFSRLGVLYLAPSLDILIVSGNPPLNPEIGALWFTSNRAFDILLDDKYASTSLQLAFVEADGQGTVTYTVDDRLASPETSVFNLMNAYGGVVASAYYFARGAIVINYSGDVLQGSIDLYGRSFSSPYEAHYTASISGVKSGTFELA